MRAIASCGRRCVAQELISEKNGHRRARSLCGCDRRDRLIPNETNPNASEAAHNARRSHETIQSCGPCLSIVDPSEKEAQRSLTTFTFIGVEQRSG